jgi:hypothetical protein
VLRHLVADAQAIFTLSQSDVLAALYHRQVTDLGRTDAPATFPEEKTGV